MYLLYLDGSGQPDLGPGRSALYALVGVCIHEGTWFALERRFNALKDRYEYPGIPFELHASDLCTTISEQNEIDDFDTLNSEERRAAVLDRRQAKLAKLSGEKRRKKKKKHRGSNPFVHLTRQERTRLYQEALEILGSHDGLRLFGEVVDKAWLLRVAGADHAVGHSFDRVVATFDTFLGKMYRPHKPNNGLLVMDNDPSADLIRAQFKGVRKHGHLFGRLRHVLDVPFFADSRSLTTLQAADLAAYAVRRYVKNYASTNGYEEQDFMRIYHKFDQANGQLHGLRHYCERGSCSCRICMDRGYATSSR